MSQPANQPVQVYCDSWRPCIPFIFAGGRALAFLKSFFFSGTEENDDTGPFCSRCTKLLALQGKGQRVVVVHGDVVEAYQVTKIPIQFTKHAAPQRPRCCGIYRLCAVVQYSSVSEQLAKARIVCHRTTVTAHRKEDEARPICEDVRNVRDVTRGGLEGGRGSFSYLLLFSDE